ncbi:glycosyltransferase family 25 protein [Calothrix sp. CCY 0018]|uniref:glycosyltransferase family 25 protein n=1 Tax=Calothrix sp. CCY 0018 TaxID=3103864 RepID=UPI0039C756D2
MKFIEFFDRIYVINLPSRKDRRREIERELKNAGMPFTSGKVELFPAIKPENSEPFYSIGCKGCFLSHLNVLKQAKMQGLKNVLIVEDDLEIAEYFQQYEDVILAELIQTNWDIVHFGYCDSPEKDVSLPIFQSFSGEIIGTQFYAVHEKVYDQLINFFEVLLQRPAGHPDGGPMSPDGVFNVFKWQYPDITRLIAVPSFGGQRSSRSDVSPSWFDQLPILKTFVESLRKLGIITKIKNFLNSQEYS